MTRKMNCARAAPVPTAIQDGIPRAAPSMGTVACVTAITSASIDAKCPTSGTMLPDLSVDEGLAGAVR